MEGEANIYCKMLVDENLRKKFRKLPEQIPVIGLKISKYNHRIVKSRLLSLLGVESVSCIALSKEMSDEFSCNVCKEQVVLSLPRNKDITNVGSCMVFEDDTQDQKLNIIVCTRCKVIFFSMRALMALCNEFEEMCEEYRILNEDCTDLELVKGVAKNEKFQMAARKHNHAVKTLFSQLLYRDLATIELLMKE